MKMWIDSWADNWVSVKWDHVLGKYMLSIHCGGKTEYKAFNQDLLDQLISEYNLEVA